MNIHSKSNNSLHYDTKNLVLEEKKYTALILTHLQENRHRRLYAELGYSSLFEYCVKELGYSHSETHRRLSSAKLMEAVPEAKELLQEGKISLTTLAQIQTHLNQSEKQNNQTTSQEEKRQLVLDMQNLPTREVEKKLIEQRPLTTPPLPKEVKKQVTSNMVWVNFNLKSETLKLLERAKSYLTKTNEQSWDEVLQQLADKFIEQQFVKSKKMASPSSLPNLPTPQPKISRYIPLPIRSEVWARSNGKCEFISHLTGRQCSSHHRLQYAHLLAHSKGGVSSAANIVLMCSAHHALESAQEFPVQNSALWLTAAKGKKGDKSGGKQGKNAPSFSKII